MADLDIENDSAEAPLRRAIGNVSVDPTQGPLLRDIIIALLALGAETPPATSLLGTDASSNKLYYTMTALMNSLDTVLAPASVADGATITLDLGNSRNFEVAALGGNRTLAFSNYTGKAGRTGWIEILQDGTGGRTLTPGTDVLPSDATAGVIALNDGINERTTLPYRVTSGNKVVLG
mgnify:FL=1